MPSHNTHPTHKRNIALVSAGIFLLAGCTNNTQEASERTSVAAASSAAAKAAVAANFSCKLASLTTHTLPNEFNGIDLIATSQGKGMLNSFTYSALETGENAIVEPATGMPTQKAHIVFPEMGTYTVTAVGHADTQTAGEVTIDCAGGFVIGAMGKSAMNIATIN